MLRLRKNISLPERMQIRDAMSPKQDEIRILKWVLDINKNTDGKL